MFFPPRRILLFSLSIVILLASGVQPQSWSWKNPPAGSGFIYDVEYLGGSRWIKGGEAGAIFLSTDDGTSWSQVFNPMGNRAIKDIFQLSSSVLYAAGYGTPEAEPFRIIKSTDSGSSWNAVFTGSHAGEKIWVFSEDVFLVLLSGGGLIRTTDGGVTFSDNIYMGASDNFNELFFINNQTGFASGASGYLAKTTDGGLTWTAVFADLNAGFNCIWFTDAQTGYFGSSFGRIIKTTNGGQTFSLYETGTFDSFSDIVFSGSSTGYAAGLFGAVYRTTNSGATWVKESEQSGQFYDIYSIKAKSTGTAIAAGAYGNMIKRNNSPDWFFLQHTPLASVTSMDWADSLRGFATMSTGHLLRTSNGGETWSSVLMREGIYADKVIFANQNQGTLFIGADSAFYTSNGGNTWSRFALPEGTFSIAEAHFPDNQTGYAVGLAGTVLKTTNGGASWFSLPMAQGVNLDDVFFLTPQKGFVTSYFGGTYRTTNGGTSWQLISGLEGTASSLSFPTPMIGYSIGAPGYAFKTTDGGDTWFPITVPDNNHHSVEFTSAETGYTAGGTGYIYKTTNGGASWVLERAGIGTLDQTVYDLDLNPDGGLWAVTAFGGILKKTGTDILAVQTLFSPSNMSTGLPLMLLFQWKPFPDAEYYQIQYSVYPDFSDSVTELISTFTFYQMIDEQLDLGRRYYWRVRPVTFGEPRSFSDTWWFETYDPPLFLGDVDLNSAVQSYDASMILRHIVSAILINKQQKRNANVTTNEAITSFDASVVLRYITGLVTSLPYAETGATLAHFHFLNHQPVNDTVSVIPLQLSDGAGIFSLDLLAEAGAGMRIDSIRSRSANVMKAEKAGSDKAGIALASASPFWIDFTGEAVWIYITHTPGLEPQLTVSYQFNESGAQIITYGAPASSETNSVPAEFSLFQNYPNPFNPETIIRFSLAHEGFTEVGIYDILGNELTRPVYGTMKSGAHEIRFDGSSYPSGIYLCELRSGGKRSIIKMLLVR